MSLRHYSRYGGNPSTSASSTSKITADTELLCLELCVMGTDVCTECLNPHIVTGTVSCTSQAQSRPIKLVMCLNLLGVPQIGTAACHMSINVDQISPEFQSTTAQFEDSQA